MNVFKPICIFSVLLVPCLASSFAHLEHENRGSPCLAQIARDFSMGGTLRHLAGEAPVLETSFCITHHASSSSEKSSSFSLWSIPYFSLCFPVGSSILGFCRKCIEDHHYRVPTSAGIVLSSGTLWNNSIWWKHRLSTRFLLKLEAGVLTGEMVKVANCNSHLFLRKRRANGNILSGSLALTQEFCETYGGIRYCNRGGEHPSETWIGFRKEVAESRLVGVEIVCCVNSNSIKGSSGLPEVHFGVEEKISEVVRLRYGFAAEPSPSLFCLTVGCGLNNEMVGVDTAVGAYFVEKKGMVQLMVTLSTRL